MRALGALSVCCVLLGVAQAEPEVRRLLYMATPDGAQPKTASGAGLLVFDIDDGHKFVKRIGIPDFKEGIRGLTGCTATKRLYFSSTNRRLGCFDIETETVLWSRQYPAGCDRSCVTTDGRTVFAPSGWWYGGKDAGFLEINAADGELRRQIAVGPRAHNSIASLDGRFVYLGTTTTLTQFDARSGEVLRTISPVGESGVFPYTVDSSNRYAYVCLGGHVGFDVVDLSAGKAVHRVLAGEEPIRHRTHGAGMTPDERELWISDQKGKKLFIFDLTAMPPAPKGHVELSEGGHGWVCFSLDGATAWCHTPDVFDARTKERVATLRDGNGKPFSSSKFIEVQMRGDRVVRIGNEFGLGRLPAE